MPDIPVSASFYELLQVFFTFSVPDPAGRNHTAFIIRIHTGYKNQNLVRRININCAGMN